MVNEHLLYLIPISFDMPPTDTVHTAISRYLATASQTMGSCYLGYACVMRELCAKPIRVRGNDCPWLWKLLQIA